MPSDTTTITVPTALVEAARSAMAGATPRPWRAGSGCVYEYTGHAAGDPEAPDTRLASCGDSVADAICAAVALADAILAAPPAPAGVTVDAACARAIERRAVAERCAVGRCAYALREALDLPRDESGDEYATWETALDRVRALAGDAAADLDALEAVMRDATPALDTMREMAESVGYGYWHPDNPHDFSPDEQSCTADEIAAHKAACEAYDQGARVAPPPVHDIGRDDAGRVVVSLLTPAWGIGSYVMRDDAMGAARSVVLAVGPLVAEVRRLRAVRDAAEAYERALHAANVVDYDAGDEWQLRRQAVRDGIDTLRAAIDAAQGVPRG